MRKLFVIILATGFYISEVTCNPASSWVVSNEGKLLVKKITIGETSAKLILEDGIKKIVALDQIDSYSIDGRVFKKLPLYLNGKDTGKTVFMELLRSQGEFNFYRYYEWSYCPNSRIENYLVFMGDSLFMEYDEKSHL